MPGPLANPRHGKRRSVLKSVFIDTVYMNVMRL
jgi:hypothetical protein